MQTILHVSPEFQARFVEIEFILTNYFFVKSISDSKISIDSTEDEVQRVLEEAMTEAKRWSSVTVSQVHEAILQGGVRNNCSIEIYSRPLKVADIRSALISARDRLALIGHLLTKDKGSNSIESAVTALRKSSSWYDIPRDLLYSIIYGPNKDKESQFAELYNNHASQGQMRGVM